jgi:hypothetical protein
MNKIRLLLTVITIVIVVVPLVGTLLAYQGNLLGLFVPPELTQVADDLMGGDGDNGGGLEPPTMVGEPQYNATEHTFAATFEFKNNFPINITVNSLTGNIECEAHRHLLGNASLSEAISIDAGETGTMTILGKWTDEAFYHHFPEDHSGEETVDVVLVDFALDISGIQIQLDQNQMEQTMQVPNPEFQG